MYVCFLVQRLEVIIWWPVLMATAMTRLSCGSLNSQVYIIFGLYKTLKVFPHTCVHAHTHTNVYMKFRLLLSYHQWYIRRIWQFIFSNSLFCSRKGIAGQPATWPSYDSFPINYSSYEIQMIVCKLHSSLNSFGWVFQRALSLKLLHLRNHTNQMDRSM